MYHRGREERDGRRKEMGRKFCFFCFLNAKDVCNRHRSGANIFKKNKRPSTSLVLKFTKAGSTPGSCQTNALARGTELQIPLLDSFLILAQLIYGQRRFVVELLIRHRSTIE